MNLRNELDQELQDEWSHRSAVCHILVVKALVKLARAEDEEEARVSTLSNVEAIYSTNDVQLRHYRKVQDYATSFDTFYSLQPELEGDLAQELVKGHFEATLQLQEWDKLTDVANVSVVFGFSMMDTNRNTAMSCYERSEAVSNGCGHDSIAYRQSSCGDPAEHS